MIRVTTQLRLVKEVCEKERDVTCYSEPGMRRLTREPLALAAAASSLLLLIFAPYLSRRTGPCSPPKPIFNPLRPR